MKKLFGLFALLATFNASAFNCRWNFTDFTQGGLNVRAVYITTIAPYGISGTNILTGDRRSYTTANNSSLTVSNMVNGRSYRVEFLGPTTTTTITNNFDTNVVGNVNAVDYLTPPTIVDGNAFGWSRNQADARFLRTNINQYLRQGTNIVYVTNADGTLTIHGTATGGSGVGVTAGGDSTATTNSGVVTVSTTIPVKGVAAGLNQILTTNDALVTVNAPETNLNASSLTSGTIPDARFPAILPAVDGSQLTGISGSGIEKLNGKGTNTDFFGIITNTSSSLLGNYQRFNPTWTSNSTFAAPWKFGQSWFWQDAFDHPHPDVHTIWGYNGSGENPNEPTFNFELENRWQNGNFFEQMEFYWTYINPTNGFGTNYSFRPISFTPQWRVNNFVSNQTYYSSLIGFESSQIGMRAPNQAVYPLTFDFPADGVNGVSTTMKGSLYMQTNGVGDSSIQLQRWAVFTKPAGEPGSAGVYIGNDTMNNIGFRPHFGIFNISTPVSFVVDGLTNFSVNAVGSVGLNGIWSTNTITVLRGKDNGGLLRLLNTNGAGYISIYGSTNPGSAVLYIDGSPGSRTVTEAEIASFGGGGLDPRFASSSDTITVGSNKLGVVTLTFGANLSMHATSDDLDYENATGTGEHRFFGDAYFDDNVAFNGTLSGNAGGLTGYTTTNLIGSVNLTNSYGTIPATRVTGLTGGGDALTANPLSQFAATTSSQLSGVLSDEAGTGAFLLQSNSVYVASQAIVVTNAGTASANSNTFVLPGAIGVTNAAGALSLSGGTIRWFNSAGTLVATLNDSGNLTIVGNVSLDGGLTMTSQAAAAVDRIGVFGSGGQVAASSVELASLAALATAQKFTASNSFSGGLRSEGPTYVSQDNGLNMDLAGKPRLYLSTDTNATLTSSGTARTDQEFMLVITNSAASAKVYTLPNNVYDEATRTVVSTLTVDGLSQLSYALRYNGTGWFHPSDGYNNPTLVTLSTNGPYNGNAITNVSGNSLRFPTNGSTDNALIDIGNKYVSTNHTANFTITGFLAASVDLSNTNVQWATYTWTNNSVGAKTITLPASWQDLGSKGNPVYNTNIGTLSVIRYPNVFTNYLWVGR